jgi:hypothetical protein
MPETGGQLGGLSNTWIVIVLLAGAVVLLLLAVSLVHRQSTRTKTER